jgi:hypothetical protein
MRFGAVERTVFFARGIVVPSYSIDSRFGRRTNATPRAASSQPGK